MSYPQFFSWNCCFSKRLRFGLHEPQLFVAISDAAQRQVRCPRAVLMSPADPWRVYRCPFYIRTLVFGSPLTNHKQNQLVVLYSFGGAGVCILPRCRRFLCVRHRSAQIGDFNAQDLAITALAFARQELSGRWTRSHRSCCFFFTWFLPSSGDVLHLWPY